MMNKVLSIICLLVISVSQAHVGLLSPSGGEQYDPGDVVKIEWEVTIPHNTDSWELRYSTNGGASWIVIAAGLPAGTLTYNWTVPNVKTSEARIRVFQRNIDYSDFDDASGEFTIGDVSSPANPTITGFEDYSDQYGLKVYPNPAIDYVTVKIEGIQSIGITDFAGRSLYQQLISDPTSTAQLAVSNLVPGVYLLIIGTSEGIETRRLRIQR